MASAPLQPAGEQDARRHLRHAIGAPPRRAILERADQRVDGRQYGPVFAGDQIWPGTVNVSGVTNRDGWGFSGRAGVRYEFNRNTQAYFTYSRGYKAFALDLANHGIRSNTIAPTFIETPLTAPFFEDEAFRAAVLGKIKLGRIGQVQDLMGAVVYLASDASALVTGTSLVVDGGWTAD